MTGSIRIFEKLNFNPKLSALAFLKVKLPNMTDWHNMNPCVGCNERSLAVEKWLPLGLMFIGELNPSEFVFEWSNLDHSRGLFLGQLTRDRWTSDCFGYSFFASPVNSLIKAVLNKWLERNTGNKSQKNVQICYFSPLSRRIWSKI